MNKQYSSGYYLKHKDKIKEQSKKNRLKLGKVRINERQQKYNIKNNYKYEKTQQQRLIRSIKRKTRLLFPLINKKCKICLSTATEHHHTTKPIQYDKFIYACHKCHIEANKFIREVNKTNGKHI